MLANYLIGLREGLEASLVVSILVAFLVKSDRRDRLPLVAGGVFGAIALSVGFGALLTYAGTDLLSRSTDQEAFAGVLGVIAVGFVTWMIFWMRRTARFMKRELEGRLSSAIEVGGFAVALTAFLAVGREGLETALFLWSALQGATDATPLTGALLGILTAVVLAYLLYRSTVSLNLQKFFTWTGAGLVVVAGGVLGYAVHDLQEGEILGGFKHNVDTFSDGTWLSTFAKGLFNIDPVMTYAQIAVYIAYVVVVMALFVRGVRGSTKPVTSVKAPTPASV